MFNMDKGQFCTQMENTNNHNIFFFLSGHQKMLQPLWNDHCAIRSEKSLLVNKAPKEDEDETRRKFNQTLRKKCTNLPNKI